MKGEKSVNMPSLFTGVTRRKQFLARRRKIWRIKLWRISNSMLDILSLRHGGRDVTWT